MKFQQSNVVTLYDAQFKYLYEVPSHLVVGPRECFDTTHLVACRNYRPCEPNSCLMGRNCKFVHADVDYGTLEAHPIHVNHVWRHEDLCMYERLPPGWILSVALPNNREPSSMIRSECIIRTRGSVGACNNGSLFPVSHCAHYYYNGLCNRREECGFVHALCIDPSILCDYKRVNRQSRHRSGFFNDVKKNVWSEKFEKIPQNSSTSLRPKVSGKVVEPLLPDNLTAVVSNMIQCVDISPTSSDGPAHCQSRHSFCDQDDGKIMGASDSTYTDNVSTIKLTPSMSEYSKETPNSPSKRLYQHNPYHAL